MHVICQSQIYQDATYIEAIFNSQLRPHFGYIKVLHCKLNWGYTHLVTLKQSHIVQI